MDEAARITELLEAASRAQEGDAPVDVEQLARTLEESESEVRLELERLDGMGLLFDGFEDEGPPAMLKSGRQCLGRRGEVAEEVLRFLPGYIDDLYAREALLESGVALVEEFRDELLQGDAVRHAAQLVPVAFADAVDEALALNLFAATVALMARLSEGGPAGCLAEEIMAVGLLDEAGARLAARGERGELTETQVEAATSELRGLFELFEDDDVLDLFEMREPSDAAVASEDPARQPFGIVEQRIEAWFTPFGSTIPTGHIAA
jgi:hypothetical protein